MPKPKQARLPGHPGPSEVSIQRRQKIAELLEQLDGILWPVLEQLPAGSKLTMSHTIKGDRFEIRVSPKIDPEAE